jgi:hypothetical protein
MFSALRTRFSVKKAQKKSMLSAFRKTLQINVISKSYSAVVTLPGGDNGVPPPVGVRDAKAMWHLAVPGIVLFLW